jgi:hypothetical protein
LPRPLGRQPRNPAALAAGQAAAASNQAPLLRGSHGEDGAEDADVTRWGDDNEDDDEQDDEGLWPGQLPPLSPPPRSSEAGAARAGRAADVTRWGDDCAGNCAETSARSGAEHESGGGAGMYLPLCPNGLPALRVRRAWFGCAVLERYGSWNSSFSSCGPASRLFHRIMCFLLLSFQVRT